MDTILAEARYNCKRYAAKSKLGQVSGVPRPRKTPKVRKEPKTTSHAIFMRRIKEELEEKKLNPNALEAFGAVQRTLQDALDGADSRLSTIHRTAKALGLDAWQLLKDRQNEQAPGGNVTKFPPASPMLSREDHPARRRGDRKKGRR